MIDLPGLLALRCEAPVDVADAPEIGAATQQGRPDGVPSMGTILG
jgi:hypothetical protein